LEMIDMCTKYHNVTVTVVCTNGGGFLQARSLFLV